MERLNFKRINNAISTVFSSIIHVSIVYDTYQILWSDNTILEVEENGSFVKLIESFFQIIHPEDMKTLLDYYSLGHLLSFLEESQISENFELRYLGRDNEYHWIDVSVTPLKGDIREEKDLLIIVRNIESQIEREEKIKKELKDIQEDCKKRTELISRVLHDVRTPMNVVIGMANIAQNSEEDLVKIKGCLDKILTASGYVMTLVNTLLDSAKIEYKEEVQAQDDFTLEQIIEDVTNIVIPEIEKKSIDFQICVGKLTSRKFVGDRLLLNRVLINLISNATKFVDYGGKIRLFLEELSADKENIEICFTVEDNGIGMSKEFVGKVFQPFEQEEHEKDKSYGGSGLGLAICKVLVEKLGGKISVQSEKEKGSLFKVEIPLKIQHDNDDLEEKVESLELSSVANQDYQGKRILMVEDNELNIEVMLAILEDKNLELEIARNGQEAVELFEKSSQKYYDLILMDIMMPIKNGIEATCEIRNLNREDSKEIPIIAMTADGYNDYVSNILEDKLNDYVLKPIDTKQLYTTLHFWLKT